MTDTLPDNTLPPDSDRLLTREDPATAPLAALETHMPFVRRHVGPGDTPDRAHGRGPGPCQPRCRHRRGGPRGDPHGGAARPATGAVRGRGGRRAACPRGEEPPMVQMIGLGLLRHVHTGGHPAPSPGEPRVVHRLHAVPARDQPGQARGTAQLPDHDRGPHRAPDGERVAARRGDGRGRGHDHGGPRVPLIAHRSSSTPTSFRRRSRCCRPAPARSASRSTCATCAPRVFRPATSPAWCCSTRRAAGSCATPSR